MEHEVKNDKINLTKLVGTRSIYENLVQYVNTVDFLYNNNYTDKISAPFIYLIRHAIEIGLKSSILYLCTKSDLNSMCKEEKLDGHQLTRLYNCFNQHWKHICNKYDLKNQGSHLQQIVKETNKYHKDLKELINFYDEYDKNSTLFRYGNSSSIQMQSNYSFIIDEYCGTVKLINTDDFINKYKNAMLVFKHLEDALEEYFDYKKEMNNQILSENR